MIGKILNFIRKIYGYFPLVMARGFIVGLNSVSILSVAFVLNPDEFGDFVFLWAVAQMTAVFASVGGQNYLLREASARQGNPCRGVRPFEALAIAFIIPTAVLAFLGSSVWIVSMERGLWFSDFASNPFGVSVVLAVAWVLILIGHLVTPIHISGLIAASMLLRDGGPSLLLLAGLCLALVMGQSNTIGVLAGIASVGAVLVVILAGTLFLFRAKVPSLWRETDSKRGRGLTRFWGSSVLGNIMLQIDVIFGGMFLSSIELGHYQIIKKIVNIASLTQIIANWKVVVNLGKAYAEGNARDIQKLCRQGVEIAFIPGFFLLTMIATSLPAFLWLYGIPSVSAVWVVFALLGFGGLINLACGVNFAAAAQCNLEFYALSARILGVFASVTSIFIFGTDLCVQHLALATFLSQLAANLPLSILIYRRLGIDTSILSILVRK